MVVSDDDSATVHKTSDEITTSPSTDNSSYSGSDDETVIESDQPLFLDATSPVSEHPGSNTDPLLGCNVGIEAEHDPEHDAVMAEFLQDTFQPNDPVPLPEGSKVADLAAVTAAFEDVLDPSDVEAFLQGEEETDAMMLLPDICLES